MKVLITGAKGQLGSQIIKILNSKQSELGKIDSKYKDVVVKGMDREDADITMENQVDELVNNFKPDVIINCAAYTNVDGCEDNEDNAFKVNGIGARNFAIASKKVGAKLIHISTDYVFEGNGIKPYKEYDMPNPISVYGKTKLAGEEFVKKFSNKYFIVRTSWLYGYNGNNFVKTIIKAANEKGCLTVVNDQRGNPTNAEDLAHHILKIAVTEEYGIYHCTGNGECSWYDFACEIVKNAEIKCEVKPVISEQFHSKAKRPTFSSLDNMMIRCTVGDEMREWREALKQFILNIKVKE